jgi:fructose-1-phosphate kinase PfkB-like protein
MTAARIVTLTLNPAVDLACAAASVRPTHKTRTFEERFMRWAAIRWH